MQVDAPGSAGGSSSCSSSCSDSSKVGSRVYQIEGEVIMLLQSMDQECALTSQDLRAGEYTRFMLDVVGGPGEASSLPCRDTVESMSCNQYLALVGSK